MAQGFHDVHQEVVGHGPRRDHPLLGKGDGTGFRRADPDGHVALAVDLAQQDQRLVGRQFDPNAHNLDFDHQMSIRRDAVLDQGPVQDRQRSLISRAASAARAWEAASLPRGQGRNGPFHEAEFTFGGSLEGPQVARFQAVALQLHARAGHLERVFVELAVDVADQAEAQQRLEQRDAGAGLGAELLLAESPYPVLQLGGQFRGDDPRRHRDARAAGFPGALPCRSRQGSP